MLADTTSDISNTVQLFIQSVSVHLQTIENRVDHLQEKITALNEGDVSG